MATSKEVLKQATTLFDILRNDHQTISKIMDEAKEAPAEEKSGLLAQLDVAFVRHAESEERYFYLRLRGFSGMRDLIHSALSEHDTVRELLQQLEAEEMLSPRWQSIFGDLDDAIQRHLEKEEQIMFPRALRLLPVDELDKIKELIEEEHRKDPLPHRYRDISGPQIRT